MGNGSNGVKRWGALVSAAVGTIVLIGLVLGATVQLLGLQTVERHQQDVETLRSEREEALEPINRKLDRLIELQSCQLWEIPRDDCPASPLPPPKGT